MKLALILEKLLHFSQSKKMLAFVPLCFLLFKKSVKSFNKFPDIPFLR